MPEAMAMPQKRFAETNFSYAFPRKNTNARPVSEGVLIQKRQGHPKARRVGTWAGFIDDFFLWRARRSQLPMREEISQPLIHFVERISTKKDRLIMCRIVDVVRRGFEIERTQLGFVHFLQFTC